MSLTPERYYEQSSKVNLHWSALLCLEAGSCGAYIDNDVEYNEWQHGFLLHADDTCTALIDVRDPPVGSRLATAQKKRQETSYHTKFNITMAT